MVSVSDKVGLTEFLGPLVKDGLRLISTGGTAKFLREKGFEVVDISEVTGFPEVMDGRVKTLHPHVHMGLLARRHRPEDLEILQKFKVSEIDLVVVNLYPFEETARSGAAEPELIEKIDIGGPSMLRSAAKNFAAVTVVCDPRDYSWVLDQRKDWTQEKRKKLAAKVFAHTSVYDSVISRALGFSEPEVFPFGGRLVQSLRYGENPHQTAQWYESPLETRGLSSARVIQGKELSYNNLLDLDAAVALVKEFQEPACVAVKHNNPCGVAVSKDLAEAVRLALAADPVSVFGGIIALNREVGLSEAQQLQALFLECVVAPSFSDEALQEFGRKKNLRLLAWPSLMEFRRGDDLRSVAGGFLVQSPDRLPANQNHWKFTGDKADPARLRDLVFGEKVCASLKSNAIALVAEGRTVGLGMGQVNRVDAVEQAIKRWKTHHPQLSGDKVSLISDAFFPFPDSVELAAAQGIRWILQPGGSVKDEDVLKKAQALGVHMVLTGERHFRH